MSGDKLAFLEETQAEPEVVEAPQPEPQPEPEPAKAAEPEPEPATGATAEPPSAPEERHGTVPLSVVLDEREKRQAAQREAEEARKRYAALEAQINAQRQQPKAPDFFEKPDEAFQHRLAPIQQQVVGQKLQVSQFLAEREFGKETVAEALAFFDENPQLSHSLVNHPSPFHAAIELHKRAKLFGQMGDDPEAWVNAQVEAKLQERLASVQQSPAKAPAPPPSLSRASAAGGGESLKPGSAFDALPIR